MNSRKRKTILDDGTVISLRAEAKRRGVPLGTAQHRYKNPRVPNTLEALFAPSMPTGKAKEIVWCGKTLKEWHVFLVEHRAAITLAGISSWYHKNKKKFGSEKAMLREFMKLRGLDDQPQTEEQKQWQKDLKAMRFHDC